MHNQPHKKWTGILRTGTRWVHSLYPCIRAGNMGTKPGTDSSLYCSESIIIFMTHKSYNKKEEQYTNRTSYHALAIFSTILCWNIIPSITLPCLFMRVKWLDYLSCTVVLNRIWFEQLYRKRRTRTNYICLMKTLFEQDSLTLAGVGVTECTYKTTNFIKPLLNFMRSFQRYLLHFRLKHLQKFFKEVR